MELGRGGDYAWSATSAGSDRLEKLCNPDGSAPSTSSTSYVFNGRCVAMYERTDRELAGPTGSASPEARARLLVAQLSDNNIERIPHHSRFWVVMLPMRLVGLSGSPLRVVTLWE